MNPFPELWGYSGKLANLEEVVMETPKFAVGQAAMYLKWGVFQD